MVQERPPNKVLSEFSEPSTTVIQERVYRTTWINPINLGADMDLVFWSFVVLLSEQFLLFRCVINRLSPDFILAFNWFYESC